MYGCVLSIVDTFVVNNLAIGTRSAEQWIIVSDVTTFINEITFEKHDPVVLGWIKNKLNSVSSADVEKALSYFSIQQSWWYESAAELFCVFLILWHLY